MFSVGADVRAAGVWRLSSPLFRSGPTTLWSHGRNARSLGLVFWCFIQLAVHRMLVIRLEPWHTAHIKMCCCTAHTSTRILKQSLHPLSRYLILLTTSDIKHLHHGAQPRPLLSFSEEPASPFPSMQITALVALFVAIASAILTSQLAGDGGVIKNVITHSGTKEHEAQASYPTWRLHGHRQAAHSDSPDFPQRLNNLTDGCIFRKQQALGPVTLDSFHYGSGKGMMIGIISSSPGNLDREKQDASPTLLSSFPSLSVFPCSSAAEHKRYTLINTTLPLAPHTGSPCPFSAIVSEFISHARLSDFGGTPFGLDLSSSTRFGLNYARYPRWVIRTS